MIEKADLRRLEREMHGLYDGSVDVRDVLQDMGFSEDAVEMLCAARPGSVAFLAGFIFGFLAQKEYGTQTTVEVHGGLPENL